MSDRYPRFPEHLENGDWVSPSSAWPRRTSRASTLELISVRDNLIENIRQVSTVLKSISDKHVYTSYLNWDSILASLERIGMDAMAMTQIAELGTDEAKDLEIPTSREHMGNVARQLPTEHTLIA